MAIDNDGDGTYREGCILVVDGDLLCSPFLGDLIYPTDY